MFSSSLFPGLGSCGELVRVIFFSLVTPILRRQVSAMLLTSPLLLGSPASSVLVTLPPGMQGESIVRYIGEFFLDLWGLLVMTLGCGENQPQLLQ